MNTLPLAINMPGGFELILLTGLGLLFFGKRLPDVGRSIGQTIVQFKKGLNDVNADVDKAADEKPKLKDETKSV
jgi:sec-independent protein translocase protein TatA